MNASPSASAASGLPLSGVLALAVTGFCCFLGVYATQPLLPLFETIFHASKAAAGLTVSAPTMAVALVAPFVGAFADRVGRRRIIVPATMLLVVPMLLVATAQTLPQLIFWRFLQGITVPGIYVVAIAYVTEEAGAASVGAVMAAFVSGNVFGGLFGRIIVGLVAAHVGWRWAFVTIGLLTFFGSLVTWRWLPPSKHFVKDPTRRLRAADVVHVFGTKRLLATYAIGFTLLFELVAVFTYVTFYLSAAPFQLGTAALSGIFIVYAVGAVATPVAGPWIDRVGSRAVVVASVVMSALGLLLTLVHSLPCIIAGLAVFCSGVFIGQPAITSYLRIASPTSLRSLAAGFYVTCYYIGGSVGGVLPAAAWARAGWPGCIALVIAVEAATIGLAVMAWGRHIAEPHHAPR